jgi:hypothetical protein
MLQTKDKIQAWLDKMKVTNYKINSDLTVDVNGDVNLGNNKLHEIPIQFGIVNGNFSIWHNKLISLKGCPHKVTENFDCTHNQLESLQYCPKEIGEDFLFHVNKISTFEYLPQSVGNITIYENDIQNINDFKTQLKGSFMHQCTLPTHCIAQFKHLYEYNSANYYHYSFSLSAKQFNALHLKNELSIEMHENNKPTKKMKV